jgi:hypothetical protein
LKDRKKCFEPKEDVDVEPFRQRRARIQCPATFDWDECPDPMWMPQAIESSMFWIPLLLSKKQIVGPDELHRLKIIQHFEQDARWGKETVYTGKCRLPGRRPDAIFYIIEGRPSSTNHHHLIEIKI